MLKFNRTNSKNCFAFNSWRFRSFETQIQMFRTRKLPVSKLKGIDLKNWYLGKCWLLKL